jgi:hypothetical protein
MPQRSTRPTGFAHLYPNIARWVQSYGWIEIGADHYSRSLVRAYDEGSTVWESQADDVTLEEALQTLDTVLAQRMKEYYA